MNDAPIVRDFLKRHGEALIDQGYTVVPIQQGKKAPGYDGWQKAKPNKDQVREWLGNGFRNAGVGILTKFTCAIDIDCLDTDAAKKFEAWCVREIGKPLIRIGKAPKRLLLYRTVEPFRKRRSTIYVDEWQDKQMIEVLGDGQQFVAFHIHPDTGKPYQWVGESPLDVRATDLTELKPAQIDALIAEFEAHAKAQQWDVLKAARAAATGDIDSDNPWLEDSQPIELNTAELRSRLLLVPGAEDYETWSQVGMALYHQFDGEEEGFDLWNEWSETADNYDPDSLERHWKTFGIAGKKRAPLTARYILRLAKEAVEQTTLELGVKLRDAFVNAKDLKDWEKARQMSREAEIDGLARSALAAIAKDRRDAITGVKTPLAEIKRAIAYSPSKSETMPSWCEGWVYDTAEDRFFHTVRKVSASKQGFDAMYDRKAMTKVDVLNGKQAPSMSASELALNVFKVPTVDGRIYWPGRDEVFHEPNGVFANAYPEHEIPAKPEVLLPKDKKAVERVKRHIAHLIADETEQRMVLDWLSWVVQNPGKHANYAVLLQGVEGDGKSFFGELLRAVMGISNVRMASANTVIKSDFTEWAYGQCVCCIEEVRLASTAGVDKWAAINKIKLFITNNTIEIHPKGKSSFNVKNTTSYMLFTNHQDALPLDDNSRRYLVIFSRWQHKEDLAAFLRANPLYFTRLYDSLAESAGALRQWLLEHEQHESFQPLGNAPETGALRIMVRKSKSEFAQVLADVIQENETPGASRELVDITELQDVMTMRGVDWPGPKLLGTLLEREGYEFIGRVRVGDEPHRFYSRSPSKWVIGYGTANPTINTDAVRAHVAARSAMLDDEL